MSDKQLKSKAINIKGKQYVLVADRVNYFNEAYPKGSITTTYELVNDTYHFMATIIPDCDNPIRRFTGHSQATIGDGMVNKTAAMENAETSAVGRALAMMGIGVIESIASVDEINKATSSRTDTRFATMKQVKLMIDKAKWGLKTYDKDEVMNFLLTVLGKEVTQIKSSEVDEALQKIDKALREVKVTGELEESLPEKPDEVITDLPDEIDLDNVPY